MRAKAEYSQRIIAVESQKHFWIRRCPKNRERNMHMKRVNITLSHQAVPHLHLPSSLKERERREKNICICVLCYCTAVFRENIYIHNIKYIMNSKIRLFSVSV